MNYSKNLTYGRKVIKGGYNKKAEIQKRLYISWGVCILIGLIIGVLLFWGISSLFENEVHAEPIRPAKQTSAETSTEPAITFEPTATPEPKTISLGQYKLTAYCSCEKCCGYWATIRPLDEDGKPIVHTADGSVAEQGVTVAADTSLPFGSVLLIDGHEYTVQDRGGAIKGNHIDVYFESREEALQFGVQYKEVFLKEGEL